MGTDDGSDTDRPTMSDPVALIVPAVAGFGGIWLGWFLRSRTEERQWRLQHRQEAYADLLPVADEFRQAAIRRVVADPDSADAEQRTNVMLERMSDLDRASNRVKLLGSLAVRQPLETFVNHCFVTIADMARRNPQPSDQEWNATAAAEYMRLFGILLQAFRKDLGVKD
jgi:hypothetical protein